jgi:mRNA cleavage and polyadenylation factor CLP1 P-loop
MPTWHVRVQGELNAVPACVRCTSGAVPRMRDARRRNLLCCRLAELCKERTQAYQGRFTNLAAGAVVNTMGWVEGEGRAVQAAVCRTFGADVILVIGDDKLHSALQSAFQARRQAPFSCSCQHRRCACSAVRPWHLPPERCSRLCCCASRLFAAAPPPLHLRVMVLAQARARRAQDSRQTEVVKVPKSGGTVQLCRDAHNLLRDVAIQEYFTGRGASMAPSLQQVKLSAARVFRVAGSMGVQAGLLPAGMAAAFASTRLTPVDVTPELVRARAHSRMRLMHLRCSALHGLLSAPCLK